MTPEQVAAKTGMKIDTVERKTAATKALRSAQPTKPRIDAPQDAPTNRRPFSKTGGPTKLQKQMNDQGI